MEAGLAIAELISGMRKPTVSLVLGGGHSIGVPLAVSANKSFIAPSATMTIHPVRMNGTVLGVPQTLSYFEKMQERIIGFVEENSEISPKRFRQMMMNTGELVMDMGTVLTGKQAVEAGLIGSVGGLSDAIECLYGLIEEQKAANRTEDDEYGNPRIENIGEVADPAQYMRRAGRRDHSEKRAGKLRDGGRPRRKPVVRTPVATARNAMDRLAREQGGIGGGTAPQSDPGLQSDYGNGRYTAGSARGAERQNRPPQADYPQLKPGRQG